MSNLNGNGNPLGTPWWMIPLVGLSALGGFVVGGPVGGAAAATAVTAASVAGELIYESHRDVDGRARLELRPGEEKKDQE